ncbi:MAG: hypothetical protein ACMXYG_04715 [Candidatus Woesearchaeota archaeon]
MDEKLFIDLLNQTNYAILSLDKNFTVKFANQLAEEIMDFHQEDLSGLFHPFDLSNDFFNRHNLDLISKNKVNFRSKILHNNIPVEGYINAILDNGGIIGYSIFFNKAERLVNNSSPKRKKFTTIRNLILKSLTEKRKTINQLAKDIGVNWRTVESHLTYLSGKKHIIEVLSSEYVRIFDITDSGRKLVQEQKEKWLKSVNSSSNVIIDSSSLNINGEKLSNITINTDETRDISSDDASNSQFIFRRDTQ